MTDTMPTKRWTRIELLGGVLVVREPQGSPHAMGIRMVEEALRRVFATG